MELKELGIVLKSSKACKPGNTSFPLGWFHLKLTLPEMVVDDTTTTFVFNLIACEVCPALENNYEIYHLLGLTHRHP